VRVNELISLLQPFEDSTKYLSGSNYPTLALGGVCIHAISKNLDISPLITSSTIKACYAKICVELIQRFTADWDSNVLVAAKLDPRFKHLIDFNTNDQAKANIFLRHELTKVKPISNPEPVQPKSFRDYIFRRNVNELELYEGLCVYSDEVNPLDWWKTHEQIFPSLSLLARRYFSIPATSVPSERLFSKAGELVNKKRARLSTSTVQEIIFLHTNFQWIQKLM